MKTKNKWVMTDTFNTVSKEKGYFIMEGKESADKRITSKNKK